MKGGPDPKGEGNALIREKNDTPMPGLIPKLEPLADGARWQLASVTPRAKTFDVQVSSDGKLIALCGWDGHLRIYDFETRDLRYLFPMQTPTQSCAWSSDNRSVATIGQDRILRIWSLASRSLLLEARIASGNKIDWSSDGNLIAVGGDKGIYVVPVGSIDEVAATLVKETKATSITPQQLGERLAKDIVLIPGFSGTVYAVAWSPDGKLLAGGDDQGVLQVTKPDGAPTFTNEQSHQGRVQEVAWDSKSERLASCGVDAKAFVWDAAGKKIATLSGHSDMVNAVTWGLDDRYVMTGGHDRRVTLFDAEAGFQESTRREFGMKGLREVLYRIEWNGPASKMIVTSGGNTYISDGRRAKEETPWIVGGQFGGVAVHDGAIATIQSGEVLRTWTAKGKQTAISQVDPPQHPFAISIHPRGTMIAAAGGWAQKVHVWTSAGRLARSLEMESMVSACDWGANGLLAAANDKGQLAIWNSQLQLQGTTEAHESQIRGLSWNHDGTKLASVGYTDGTIKIWNAKGEQAGTVKLGEKTTIVSMRFHPKDDRLGVGYGKDKEHTVAIIGEDGSTLSSAKSRAVWGLSWSPDGKSFASAGDDGPPLIWDEKCKPMRQLVTRHQGEAVRTTWLNEDQLVTVAWDSTLRCFDVKTGEQLWIAITHADGSCATFDAKGKLIYQSTQTATRHFTRVVRDSGGKYRIEPLK